MNIKLNLVSARGKHAAGRTDPEGAALLREFRNGAFFVAYLAILYFGACAIW